MAFLKIDPSLVIAGEVDPEYVRLVKEVFPEIMYAKELTTQMGIFAPGDMYVHSRWKKCPIRPMGDRKGAHGSDRDYVRVSWKEDGERKVLMASNLVFLSNLLHKEVFTRARLIDIRKPVTADNIFGWNPVDTTAWSREKLIEHMVLNRDGDLAFRFGTKNRVPGEAVRTKEAPVSNLTRRSLATVWLGDRFVGMYGELRDQIITRETLEATKRLADDSFVVMDGGKPSIRNKEQFALILRQDSQFRGELAQMLSAASF